MFQETPESLAFCRPFLHAYVGSGVIGGAGIFSAMLSSIAASTAGLLLLYVETKFLDHKVAFDIHIFLILVRRSAWYVNLIVQFWPYSVIINPPFLYDLIRQQRLRSQLSICHNQSCGNCWSVNFNKLRNIKQQVWPPRQPPPLWAILIIKEMATFIKVINTRIRWNHGTHCLWTIFCHLQALTCKFLPAWAAL